MTGPRILLAALIGAAFVAGLPPILDVVSEAGSRAEATRAAGAGTGCSICGVVEAVREIGPAAPKDGISTVAGGGVEGIAVLLGALGGKMTIHPSTTYEVEVHMRDGSVRVLQSKTPPTLKPGDQVKARKGAIEGV